MTTTTANLGLTLPTLNGDRGVWDSPWNDNGTLLDLHDHSTGKGVKVTPTGLNLNADLTFAGNAATNLKGVVFTAQVAAPASLAVYVKSNDLYFKDGAANEVRLTASGAINIATTGGIAGDYIAASASVYYDSAAKTYRFLSAAPLPNVWQYLGTGGVDLYEQGSGILTRVRLISPGALAASYVVTFPAALPGSTLLTQVSSTGVMTWSNTIANAVAMSSTLTVGSTLGVTGLITATAGLTAAVDQNITVSGTGEFKHGAMVKNVSPLIGNCLGGWPADFILIANASYVQSVGMAKGLSVPLPLEAGDRVTTVGYTIGGNAGGTGDFVITVYRYTALSVQTSLGTVTRNNHAAGLVTYSLDITDTTLAAGDVIVVEYVCSEADQKIAPLTVTYTRP